ncbi:MAG: VTT domain-containing protein [Tetrasphaera sp.]|nr:VTT domain-containing protein [Tetrasphaera sp.]
MPVSELFSGWPAWAVFVVLALGAYARGSVTYWLGRGARVGSERSRWRRYAEAPIVGSAERWVGRVGAPLVSIGFLTVGVQTAINFSAGLLRMPQRRFQPAVIIGALLWATLYTTVGLAVVDAWLGHVPWWWALLGMAVVVLLIVVSRRITRRAEA